MDLGLRTGLRFGHSRYSRNLNCSGTGRFSIRKATTKRGPRCNEQNAEYNNQNGKCNWKNPKACALAVKYKASAVACNAVLSGLEAALNSASQAVSGAVSIAQASVNSAQTVANAAASAAALASKLSSAISATPFSIKSITVLASISGGAGAGCTVVADVVINGKAATFTFSVVFPAEISAINAAFTRLVQAWFEENVLGPLNADFLADKLDISQL